MPNFGTTSGLRFVEEINGICVRAGFPVMHPGHKPRPECHGDGANVINFQRLKESCKLHAAMQTHAAESPIAATTAPVAKMKYRQRKG